MKISKIISGAQTGADRGALDAAIHCKLDYGGGIPKGRKAEDGAIPAAYTTGIAVRAVKKAQGFWSCGIERKHHGGQCFDLRIYG